jgi:hypothetical protein
MSTVFVLQCLDCNTIVGDSGGLESLLATDESDDHAFRVATVCNVRTTDSVLRCDKCDRRVGTRQAQAHLGSLLERAAVRKVLLSTPPVAAVRGALPNDSLEAVIRAQQRQLKVAMIEVSRKTAAVAEHTAQVDTKSAVLLQQRQPRTQR